MALELPLSEKEKKELDVFGRREETEEKLVLKTEKSERKGTFKKSFSGANVYSRDYAESFSQTAGKFECFEAGGCSSEFSIDLPEGAILDRVKVTGTGGTSTAEVFKNASSIVSGSFNTILEVDEQIINENRYYILIAIDQNEECERIDLEYTIK